MISSGRYHKALVIGVEKLSSIVDWQDRGTCVLFGDGAGAVVLQAVDGERGILATVTTDVERLTGRPAIGFEQFAADHAWAFVATGRGGHAREDQGSTKDG